MTENDIPEISAADYLVLAAQNHVGLLDVRTSEEYHADHRDGLLIPLSELPARIHELDPKLHWVVMCRSGGRSRQACAWMMAQGFTASNLQGGILAWPQAHQKDH